MADRDIEDLRKIMKEKLSVVDLANMGEGLIKECPIEKRKRLAGIAAEMHKHMRAATKNPVEAVQLWMVYSVGVAKMVEDFMKASADLMKRGEPDTEAVINQLREAEVELAKGMKVGEVCGRLDIAEYTLWGANITSVSACVKRGPIRACGGDHQEPVEG